MIDGYLLQIVEGFWLTIAVAIVSLLIALVLGMLAAAARLSGNPLLRTVGGVYTTVIRGIPDLVLMLIVFYGGQIGVNAIAERMGWGYIDINPFIAGTVSIGFIFGAYMGETFRGAILAVARGEIEAGHAYGMTSWQVMRRITLPAMVRHALPGFGNNWLVLVKTTALVSVIGLHDMVFKADQVGKSLREPFTYYFIAALLFLLITAVSGWGLKRLEMRFSHGVRRG
ncbi:ABC transporter permease [Gammaproteobacteria bacterium]|nr:ABC transporter permease [Gammaproteobacteria bacterium]